MATKRPKFNVTVIYPAPENKEEFERRAARAVAKVLVDSLPPEQIDELIALYKQQIEKS